MFFNKCAECSSVDVEYVDRDEIYEINGEEILSSAKYWKCNECDTTWICGGEQDNLAVLYRKYRDIHNMMQSEDIVELRRKYGLTQLEFAKLTEITFERITRYESSSLQKKEEDETFQKMKDITYTQQLLKENPDILPLNKYQQIMSGNIKEDHVYEQMTSSLRERRDIYNNFVEAIFEKITELILYLCSKTTLSRTQIYKLFFYIDFKGRKDNARGITGLTYRRGQYGPIPDNLNRIIDYLVDNGRLNKEVRDFINFQGEHFSSNSEPELSIFEDYELKIIDYVRNNFEGWNTQEISDFSLQESVYLNTKPGELISYDEAEKLNI
ncbi:MAG: type II toxin-antitoxin system antitoxin SocA domain-containing protein [Elusimicrobiota bacterium]